MSSMNVADIVAAILLFYPDEKFENDREKIHSAFLGVREKHFELLKDLIYRKNMLFPRSRVLDDVLACLQPEFLGKINPTYDTYNIKKEKLQRLWDSKLKLSLNDKESELKNVAAELSLILNA